MRARVVLLQRVHEIAALLIEPHQCSMHRLLQRIDAQRALRGCNRFVERTAPRLMIDELRVCAQRRAMQSIAFGEHPLIESLLAELKAFQKIAAIHCDGLLERFFRSAAEECFEVGDVGGDERVVDAEEIRLFDQ